MTPQRETKRKKRQRFYDVRWFLVISIVLAGVIYSAYRSFTFHEIPGRNESDGLIAYRRLESDVYKIADLQKRLAIFYQLKEKYKEGPIHDIVQVQIVKNTKEMDARVEDDLCRVRQWVRKYRYGAALKGLEECVRYPGTRYKERVEKQKEFVHQRMARRLEQELARAACLEIYGDIQESKLRFRRAVLSFPDALHDEITQKYQQLLQKLKKNQK